MAVGIERAFEIGHVGILFGIESWGMGEHGELVDVELLFLAGRSPLLRVCGSC